MGLLGYVHLFESQGTTESQIIPLKDKTVMSQNGESYIITYSDKQNVHIHKQNVHVYTKFTYTYIYMYVHIHTYL